MRLEISGRLLSRNTLLHFSGQAGPLLVATAAIPFIIRGLGVERFGILSIAWLVPEYLIFLDLGLGRATTKYVAEALGKGDKDQISRVAWTAIIVQIGLGLLGTISLISIAPLLTGKILNIPPELATEGKEIFQILALSIPVVLVSSSVTGILAAAQRFDLIGAVGAFFNTANPLLTLIGVLWFDWHLTEIVAMLVASRFLALIVSSWLCIRIFPSLKTPCFYLLELRTLLRFGGWVTVSSIAVPILLYLDRFVIGASLTMAAVAYYSVPYEIVTRLWIIPASLGTTLFPAFSMLTGQKQPERLAFLLARSMKWMLLTLGPAVIVITALATEILQGWIGSDFAQESALVLQILALGILINSMVHVQYAVVQALGRPDLTAKFHLLQLPLYIFLVWWLVSLWGITGAALAQAIRLSMEAVLLHFAACRMTALRFCSLIYNKIVPSSLLLLMFVGLAMVISRLPLTNWLRLLASGMFFCAMGATLWRYSLDRQERDDLAKFLAGWRKNAKLAY
jgi:O-antigen/teichoic acid export membrane protein